jgi:hypothetical protein
MDDYIPFKEPFSASFGCINTRTGHPRRLAMPRLPTKKGTTAEGDGAAKPLMLNPFLSFQTTGMEFNNEHTQNLFSTSLG